MTPIQNSTNSPTSWINDWLPIQDKIVLALTSTADSLPGQTRKKLHRLADTIAFARRESDILMNPLALEIFLTLVGKTATDEPGYIASQSTEHLQADALNLGVEHAVNSVLLAHLPVQSNRQRLLTMIAYPLLLLLACGMILVLASTMLLPVFESMFREFGLQLPVVTRALFAIASLVTSPWTYLWLGTFLLGIGLLAGLNRSQLCRRTGNPTAVFSASNLRFNGIRSTRGTCGDWAWHISLLMRAGLGRADAIELAGDASGRDWLRRDSRTWAQELRAGKNPFLGITHLRGLACSLLTDTLAMDNSIQTQSLLKIAKDALPLDQPGLLRDVAEIYWDRAQSRSGRHLGCLSQIFYMGVLVAVGFIVMALFAPLFQLISGLS